MLKIRTSPQTFILWHLFVHSMFRNIYSKGLDYVPLILTSFENVFPPIGTEHVLLMATFKLLINLQETVISHYNMLWQV